MNTTATAKGYSNFQRTIAREGLAEHDNGCCTPGARCWMAEGLERIANSEKSTVVMDAAPERPMPRGNGNSTSGRPVASAATDRQVAFLRSLVTQLEGAPADYPGNTTRDLVAKVLESGETLNKRQASELIENLKGHVDTLRKIRAEEIRINRAAQHTAAPAARPVTEGMYELDGIVYRAKMSGAGRLYAMRLVITDGEGSFEYAPGIINRLRAEHRMTLARASELSVRYHFCVRCAKELTKKSSIAQGMGDVCASKI